MTQSARLTTRNALTLLLASLLVGLTLASKPAAAGKLEQEIEAALRQQEEMLRSKDSGGEAGGGVTAPPLPAVNLAPRNDFRTAATTPVPRKIPLILFESEEIEIPPGQWDNAEPLTVIRKTLDADRDGIPEQIHFFDPKTGALIRRNADRSYDGKIDSWEQFADGSMIERRLDTNRDTRVDVWESYREGRMSERSVDRNDDGAKDAYFTYAGNTLAEERHDLNGDGQIDRIVIYRDGIKIRSQESREGDGHIDTWIEYAFVKGAEIPKRIERDSDGSGKVDMVETFNTSSGRSVILQREEDQDGDGEMDVKSSYRNGKLYRREFSNLNSIP
jgi:hypothetical protein